MHTTKSKIKIAPVVQHKEKVTLFPKPVAANGRRLATVYLEEACF